MKKGINLIIMEYPFEIFGPFSVFVSVYANDGTVAIAHGGTECGQGINTKVTHGIITVCALLRRREYIIYIYYIFDFEEHNILSNYISLCRWHKFVHIYWASLWI